MSIKVRFFASLAERVGRREAEMAELRVEIGTFNENLRRAGIDAIVLDPPE